MFENKKAKEIAENIKKIRELIEKTSSDVQNASLVTRLSLRNILKPGDQAFIHAITVNHELFKKEV